METERLIIRRFRPDDWRDLYEYLSQVRVLKHEPEPKKSAGGRLKNDRRAARSGPCA